MIDIRPSGYVIRKFDGDKSYQKKSKYDGIMDMIHISDKICYIRHAHGEFNKEDYDQICLKLLDMNYEILILERHNRIKNIILKEWKLG